jgi:hypothetical protein
MVAIHRQIANSRVEATILSKLEAGFFSESCYSSSYAAS